MLTESSVSKLQVVMQYSALLTLHDLTSARPTSGSVQVVLHLSTPCACNRPSTDLAVAVLALVNENLHAWQIKLCTATAAALMPVLHIALLAMFIFKACSWSPVTLEKEQPGSIISQSLLLFLFVSVTT